MIHNYENNSYSTIYVFWLQMTSMDSEEEIYSENHRHKAIARVTGIIAPIKVCMKSYLYTYCSDLMNTFSNSNLILLQMSFQKKLKTRQPHIT